MSWPQQSDATAHLLGLDFYDLLLIRYCSGDETMGWTRTMSLSMAASRSLQFCPAPIRLQEV